MKPLFSVGVTGEELSIALTCAAREGIRYYLNGVYVEVTAEGGRLVATDGRRMMVVRLAEGCYSGEGAAVLPCGFVKDCIACVKAKRDFHSVPLLLTFHDANKGRPVVVLEYGEGSRAQADTIDGKFPDWRRVVPSKVSGEAAQYDAKYLADFKKAAGMRDVSRPAAVVGYNGPTGTALVCIGAPDKYLGVLMPFCAEPLTQAPAWITAPVALKKAA